VARTNGNDRRNFKLKPAMTTKTQEGISKPVSIGKIWAIVWIAITFLMMGCQAAVHGIVEHIAGVNEQMVGTVGTILKVTLPLTVSVMIISTALFREWFEGFWMFLFGSIVLVICTILLAPDGINMFKTAWNKSSSNVLYGTALNLGIGYFNLYELKYLFSSLIFGVFLGWIWSTRLIPFFNKL
jgi:hypothetical protein